MSFFEQLQTTTQQARNEMLMTPIIDKAVSGKITIDEYRDYLAQAYHHVKHTVPLLMTVGGRLPEEKEWLRNAVAEYIEEELGHQEWILNDIEACGGDKEAVRKSSPTIETELMIAYAYDMATRVNPLGFFGMVHVLEGTSVTTADRAADGIQMALKLPDSAFSYLRSHGALDQDHVKFFESLMNKIDDAQDQALITHCAMVFYRLYGGVFRSVSGC